MASLGSNDRSIVTVTALGHALVHTYELSLPILMTIWLEELTTTRAELGLIVGLGYALFGAGALPGGMLADRFGSRTLIVACLAGMAGSFLVLSLSGTLWTIGGALVVWGLAASVYHPAGLSLISRGAVERGYAFAYHGIAGNAGIALGPLVTALLLMAVDWQTAVLLLALPAAGAAIYAWGISVNETAADPPAEPGPEGTSRSGSESRATGGGPTADGPSSDSNRATTGLDRFLSRSRDLLASAFLAVFVIAMLSGLYYRGVLTFLPDLLAGFPGFDPVQLGEIKLEPARYLYAGILTVGMAGQYAGGWLTDRIPLERGLALSFTVLAAVALAFLPVAAWGLGGVLGLSVVLGFFLFVVQPLYQALVAEYSPSDTRGLSYGYAYLAVFGLGAAGAAMSGWLIDRFGPASLFYTLAGIAAAAAAVSAWRARRARTSRTRSEHPEPEVEAGAGR